MAKLADAADSKPHGIRLLSQYLAVNNNLIDIVSKQNWLHSHYTFSSSRATSFPCPSDPGIVALYRLITCPAGEPPFGLPKHLAFSRNVTSAGSDCDIRFSPT